MIGGLTNQADHRVVVTNRRRDHVGHKGLESHRQPGDDRSVLGDGRPWWAASLLRWQLPAAPGVVVGDRPVRRPNAWPPPGRHRRSEPAAPRRESRHRPPDAGPAHRPPAPAGTPPAAPRRPSPSAAPTRSCRPELPGVRPGLQSRVRPQPGRATRPAGRGARPAPAPPGHRSMPASAMHAVGCSRMPSHDGHPRTPAAGAVSTAALAKELAGPSAGAVMRTRPAGSWGKPPFGRMGGLHYRTCVRVQGAVPPVVIAALTTTP